MATDGQHEILKTIVSTASNPRRGEGAAGMPTPGAIPGGPSWQGSGAGDADLVPVVLGGEGEVLDVGRSRRLLTRTLRRALVARDGGCAAPGCTIPAPWCEAHHVEHGEHGGPTSVDNGVLPCSHHHHAVHAGSWGISMRHGVPWFIAAAYQDPCQVPRRNGYWRPGPAPSAAGCARPRARGGGGGAGRTAAPWTPSRLLAASSPPPRRLLPAGARP
ncbi:HNH endonuclease [Citricoccus sp. SGAir0253]|uniref:HNH endonuclease signature motif containing protein n=1 Tax=Citricoccus sp. SGAir0253 TaxID=2567881 RepID=UPI0010CD69CA|nr:HNH endonuclease signature motif containing protein [Citricoccus sp. SGAir0253]QCU78173.1 HNH endonuclease [Citricoccus sp. SGAir0253]